MESKVKAPKHWIKVDPKHKDSKRYNFWFKKQDVPKANKMSTMRRRTKRLIGIESPLKGFLLRGTTKKQDDCHGRESARRRQPRKRDIRHR